MASACAWRRRVSSTVAMPPSRNWRSERSSSKTFMGILLASSVFDKVAIQSELADQRIDLPQAQWQLRVTFQVAPDKAVLAGTRFQRDGAGFIGGSDAVFLASTSTPRMRRTATSP